MSNNVLIFQSPDAERETFISAMRLTLTHRRGPKLNRDEALLILYRDGWGADDIEAYGDAAISACEQFQRTWIDKPQSAD